MSKDEKQRQLIPLQDNSKFFEKKLVPAVVSAALVTTLFVGGAGPAAAQDKDHAAQMQIQESVTEQSAGDTDTTRDVEKDSDEQVTFDDKDTGNTLKVPNQGEIARTIPGSPEKGKEMRVVAQHNFGKQKAAEDKEDVNNGAEDSGDIEDGGDTEQPGNGDEDSGDIEDGSDTEQPGNGDKDSGDIEDGGDTEQPGNGDEDSGDIEDESDTEQPGNGDEDSGDIEDGGDTEQPGNGDEDSGDIEDESDTEQPGNGDEDSGDIEDYYKSVVEDYNSLVDYYQQYIENILNGEQIVDNTEDTAEAEKGQALEDSEEITNEQRDVNTSEADQLADENNAGTGQPLYNLDEVEANKPVANEPGEEMGDMVNVDPDSSATVEADGNNAQVVEDTGENPDLISASVENETALSAYEHLINYQKKLANAYKSFISFLK